MDKILSNKLVKLLYENARYSTDDLATVLSVSKEEVEKEINKLEKDGIICGYKAIVNWDAFSTTGLTALIQLKVTPKKDSGYDQIAETILSYKEVESLYLMSSGVFDFTVIVRGDSFREVAQFVSNCLAPMECVTSTATHFILKRFKEMDVELLPEHPDLRRTMVL